MILPHGDGQLPLGGLPGGEGFTPGSNTIECIYEGGVLRPLYEIDFREGEILLLRVEKFDISKFCGAFGEGSTEEFEMFEDEAQM